MRYKELLENVSDWLWEVDSNGIYTQCSDSVYDFLGYRVDEVIGKTPFDFMNKEESLRVAVLFNAYISNKLPIHNLQNTHIHKDGHEVIVKTSAIPILDEAGDVKAYQGIDQDISQETHLKEELKNKQENISDLNRLIDNSDMIVFHWKAEDNWPVIYVSKNISMLGYSSQDFISGKIPYFSIIHPDDSEQVAKEVQEYTENKIDRFAQVYRIVNASGKIIWIDDRTVIHRDSNGKVLSYLGTIMDVTNRKRAQIALQDSEEKFRKISENALMGIFIYKERFIYVNAAFSNITGYSQEELFKMRPWEVLDESHHSVAQKALDRRLHGVEFPLTYQDMTILKKSGQKRIVRFSTQTIKYEGEYAGTGTIIDVTDIIETKKQLQLLSQAIEQTDEMIKITDKEGNLIYVNDALVAHTGYKHIELLGNNSNIFNSGKHNKAFYTDMWRQILDKKTYRGTLINRKKDSELYHEEITITPIMDSEQNIQNFVSTSQDISERIKLEEKLNKLATVDSLTRLYNRHKTNENIDAEISRVNRYEGAFSIAMIDIDHFKLINDKHGHDIGDLVLQELSTLISSLIRISDSFGRWGGEEFILLLSHTNKKQSLILTQKLIDSVSNHEFKKVGRVTVSIGVSVYTQSEKKETILKRIDEALYEAKESGRNRVVFK